MELENISNIIKNREKESVGKCSFFSVLIPIVEINDKLYILYEVRSKQLKRQPGEVSFPGGRIEKDESPEDAAVREACEELLIDKNEIEVIGEFDTLYGSTNYVMYTFLGVISEETYNNMSPSKDEVEEVYLVSLEYLMENEPDLYEFEIASRPMDDGIYTHKGIKQDYPWGKTKNVTPVYPYGENPIWGITGRITLELIKVLKGEKH